MTKFINLLKNLPNELQDKIWNLHYMDVYKEYVIQQINHLLCIEKTIEKNIEELQVNIRKIRFNNKTNFEDKNVDLIDMFESTNTLILSIINNKSYFLCCRLNNHYFSYINEIMKFRDYYVEFPDRYKIIAAYFSKKCNYNKKMIKYLKILLNLSFSCE